MFTIEYKLASRWEQLKDNLDYPVRVPIMSNATFLLLTLLSLAQAESYDDVPYPKNRDSWRIIDDSGEIFGLEVLDV